MTPEAQRIAIAEACGYTRMPASAGLMWNHKENRAVITPGSDVEKARLRMKMEYRPGKETLPDYLNDLNAMHEVEKTLTPEQEENYVSRLGAALMSDAYEGDLRWEKSNLASSDSTYRATAAQRAEAFLKTIGKWQD